MLTDSHNRIHNYLRISLTDSCNFRCAYCMPDEDMQLLPAQQLMQADEVIAIATQFVKLGVSKIRLTGGEPLVRKDVGQIIEKLAALPVQLTMTTNGVYVEKYIALFKSSGIRSINVSLDTLSAEKFKKLTRRDAFQLVWNAVESLVKEDFHVKLNVVAMKGVNEEEVVDFVRLTKYMPIHVRFIEYMPFAGNRWDNAQVLTAQEMLDALSGEFGIVKLADERHDTAKKYQVKEHAGTFAFITTMSDPFCGDCNRMRLTADGKMKNCLFGKDELDILKTLRAGLDIEPVIRKSLMLKHKVMGGQFDKPFQQTLGSDIENRSMIKIGG